MRQVTGRRARVCAQGTLSPHRARPRRSAVKRRRDRREGALRGLRRAARGRMVRGRPERLLLLRARRGATVGRRSPVARGLPAQQPRRVARVSRLRRAGVASGREGGRRSTAERVARSGPPRRGYLHAGGVGRSRACRSVGDGTGGADGVHRRRDAGETVKRRVCQGCPALLPVWASPKRKWCDECRRARNTLARGAAAKRRMASIMRTECRCGGEGHMTLPLVGLSVCTTCRVVWHTETGSPATQREIQALARAVRASGDVGVPSGLLLDGAR